VLAVTASSHDSAAIPVGMRDTLVPGASHPTVTSDACPGRIPVAENRVTSRLFGCDKYFHDFVSHPNGGHNPPGRAMQDLLHYKTVCKCKSADAKRAEGPVGFMRLLG